MSQHIFSTEYKGRSVSILMGWDRPLQGYFMVIEETDREGYLYTNLDDPAVSSNYGLPKSLDHFMRKLEEFALSIPERMAQEIKADALSNVGNRYVTYEADGTLIE
jgi:hypothetical protein